MGNFNDVMVQVSLSGEEAGRMYVKIASCYSDSMSPELKSALEETIGEGNRAIGTREGWESVCVCVLSGVCINRCSGRPGM